jgi:exodeoxyribonuclease VII small subunit
MSNGKERFEDFLAQVEEAVQELEAGHLPLEESIKKYEQGVKALQRCYQILDGAERKIQELVKTEGGKLEARAFRPEESEPAKPGTKKRAAPEDDVPF